MVLPLAEPGLLKLLMERRAANGNSLLQGGRHCPLSRNHLPRRWPASRRSNANWLPHSSLLSPLGTDLIRYPGSQSLSRRRSRLRGRLREPTFASILAAPAATGLLALLDAPALTWDDSDRKGTLMRLARASRTPGMEEPVKALIAGKVSEAGPGLDKRKPASRPCVR